MKNFIDENFKHFNAGELQRCAESLSEFLSNGGRLMLTLAGALSTAGIGRTLAPAIRSGLVSAICCTGANLEEDLFRSIQQEGSPSYDWRNLKAEDEANIENRVTDTNIPEQVIRSAEDSLIDIWKGAQEALPPHEYLYRILPDKVDSWLAAAREMQVPVFTPGWADSTLGNIFSARLIDGTLSDSTIIRNDLDRMSELADWYCSDAPTGFLQVGGGIAGDYAICVVPMLIQDLQKDVPLWSWFAQISESRPSYGGYSGAPPNEKISWQKLAVETPKFVIESDATIVLPLLLQYLLDSQY